MQLPTGTFSIITATVIFLAYILTDALYAKYTIDTAKLNAIKAATTGSIIHILLAVGVISYTQNWLYIFPLAAGSWIGTYIMIKKEKSN
jgi:uncharacterized membrane protein YfcA